MATAVVAPAILLLQLMAGERNGCFAAFVVMAAGAAKAAAAALF
jgi:hypothetical protein